MYRFTTTLCKCCCQSRYSKFRRMHFYNRWIKVRQASLPDEIKWENIGYSKQNRRFRKCAIWLIALVLTFIGMLAVVYLKYQSDGLKEDF